MGFEGYGILVNTRELQTHLAATAKGKMYHRLRQKTGKPLENPFIGYVFSEQPGNKLLSILVIIKYVCMYAHIPSFLQPSHIHTLDYMFLVQPNNDLCMYILCTYVCSYMCLF